MMTGRSNKSASETRNSVSWNVERAPNKGQELLGMNLARGRPQPRSCAAAHDQGNNSSVHQSQTL
jgi:hypothetical protein